MTTSSLSHPHATEDGTEPCPAKPVKDLVKNYKGNKDWTYRSQRFSSGHLHEGLYYGREGKGYATEVVTTAEKLPPDDLEGVKDSSGEAQSQQDNNKETRGRRQS